jgi:nucleoside 2-deoxyribosyltransferase
MYPKRTIYLAGTITGLTHDEARFGWRKTFVEILESMGADHIFCNSPMRGKDMLKNHGVLSSGHDYPTHAMLTGDAITARDYNDVRTCDLMLACFLESGNRESLGTAAEYGFCKALHKPIITVGQKDDVNIRHLMLESMSDVYTDNLEEAAESAYNILTPGI